MPPAAGNRKMSNSGKRGLRRDPRCLERAHAVDFLEEIGGQIPGTSRKVKAMGTSRRNEKLSHKGHRPKASTVFAAAFIAGAVAAFGVNRALDVHLAQSKPQVESEPIFVALRSLPQGSPVTVWDVALRDWPKAMLPTAAMRPSDSFDGQILKYPLREGQPLLAVQLVKTQAAADSQIVNAPAQTFPVPQPPAPAIPQPDLWAPAEPPTAPAATSQAAPPAAPAEAVVVAATPVAGTPVETAAVEALEAEPVAAAATAEQSAETRPTGEPTVAVEQAVETSPEAPATEPEIVSVVQPARDTPPQPQGIMPAPSTPVVRYLVVPERIALQADRYFAPATKPAPAREQTAATPPVVQHTPPVRETQQRQARQPTKPVQRQGNAPQQQRAAPAKARTASPAPRGNASAFQSMFPNLAAGMTAVEDQIGKIKRPRQAEADPAAKPQAEETEPQQSASRPSTRG